MGLSFLFSFNEISPVLKRPKVQVMEWKNSSQDGKSARIKLPRFRQTVSTLSIGKLRSAIWLLVMPYFGLDRLDDETDGACPALPLSRTPDRPARVYQEHVDIAG